MRPKAPNRGPFSFSAPPLPLGLALNGAVDISASPFPVSAAGLPAFAAKATPASTDFAAMGRPGEYHATDRIAVSAWCEGDASTEANLYAFADEVSAIVTEAPDDLGGLVFWIRPAGAEVAPHPAEKRIWLLECTFDALYLETPAPLGGAFTAGFSLGFRV